MWSIYEIIHFLNCGCRWKWRMIIAVNLSNWKEEAWKNQGFNGVRTRDLCVIGAFLYQLSYEATHWERGQFIEFISPVRSEMMWSIYEIIHFLNWEGTRDEALMHGFTCYRPPPPQGNPWDKSSPSDPGVGNCLKRFCPWERGVGQIQNISSLILRSMCYFSRS